MRLGKDPFVQYFDGEALGNALTVRHRRAGDYIYPLGAGGKHSLKKHLIARKIPANKRDRLWLLTRDSEVLWIIGYDISQRIALQANTRRVIRVQAQERKD